MTSPDDPTRSEAAGDDAPTEPPTVDAPGTDERGDDEPEDAGPEDDERGDAEPEVAGPEDDERGDAEPEDAGPGATPPGDGPDATGGAPTDDRDEARRRAVTLAGSAQRPPPRRTGLFVDPKDLRAHVGDLLAGMLGGYEVDGFGNFSFAHDGARVFVTVGPTPVGLAVNVHSVTNIDLDLSDDLARFLATTNHRLGFGALSYDTDNRAVWMRQTLLGTALDAPELQAAVATVARTAASMDDEVQRRFGGRTFEGASPDEQAAATPPTAADDSTDGSPPDRDNASGYL